MAARFSRRYRLRIALVTVLCLLFQQLAIAAYVCPIDHSAASAGAMAECPTHQPAPGEPRDALCQKHCAPDTSTGAESRSGGVPLLALPPMAYQHDALLDRCGAARGGTEPWARSTAPPPILAFTRLLI